MGTSHTVQILEECRIAPLPGSAVSPSSLPPTFFDMLMIITPPMPWIFFYELSCSTSTFLHTHLPNLKHSLSLSLQRFHLLAGRLVPGQGGGAPTVCYSDGDFITFTVAESDDDFYYLSGNHARDITRFRSLIPELPTSATKQHVLSVQVTLFPNHGIGIGISVHHFVADGSPPIHFMKTWASICRGGGGGELPFYDRSVIRNPRGIELEKIMQTQFGKIVDMTQQAKMINKEVTAMKAKESKPVMAMFVLNRAQLDKLVHWVFTKTSTKCSTFAITCAVVWTCLLKAKLDTTGDDDDDERIEWLTFGSDCRGRLGHPPIPLTYFGNCISSCMVRAKRRDLISDGNGLCTAAVAIWSVIQGLKSQDTLKEAENWIPTMSEAFSAGVLSLSVSLRLGVYDVDFGWGRPKNVELVLTWESGVVCIAENGDEGEGGVAVGVALPCDVMDRFASLFSSLFILKTSELRSLM